MRKTVTVSMILICAFMWACGYLFPTKIGEIKKNPRDFAGKEVTVSGEVTEVFAFILFKSFTLKDSTGEITVVTSRTLPAKGQKLKVKGTVKEAFAIGNQNLLVLMEKPGEGNT